MSKRALGDKENPIEIGSDTEEYIPEDTNLYTRGHKYLYPLDYIEATLENPYADVILYDQAWTAYTEDRLRTAAEHKVWMDQLKINMQRFVFNPVI